MTVRPLPLARLLALLVPAALLAGAWGFQLIGHLPPCEMCHWQRWPLYGAVVLALLALLVAPRPPLSRLLVALAAVAILLSAGLGAFHLGVERHWWAGPAHCTGAGFAAGEDPLSAILHAPVIRCDRVAWSLFGLSLAGWNMLFSGAGGIAILFLCRRKAR